MPGGEVALEAGVADSVATGVTVMVSVADGVTEGVAEGTSATVRDWPWIVIRYYHFAPPP